MLSIYHVLCISLGSLEYVFGLLVQINNFNTTAMVLFTMFIGDYKKFGIMYKRESTL